MVSFNICGFVFIKPSNFFWSKLLKAEKHDEEYLNYRKFTNFKRKSNQEMKDFILEFEHLYHKMTVSNNDMTIGESLIGYILIDAARLSPGGIKLVPSKK